jgi:hypothetical protein
LVAIIITHRRALQVGTSYRGRVAHVVGATADAIAAEEQESVVVVLHGRLAVPKERVPEGMLFFVNKGAAALWPDQKAVRRRGGEEGGLLIALDIAGEDVGEGVRQEEATKVREEEGVVVDGCTPRATDAPGLHKRAAGEAAEDLEDHVVGQTDGATIVVGVLHRWLAQMRWVAAGSTSTYWPCGRIKGIRLRRFP